MAEDFLLEIGTEELPPKALASLSAALVEGFTAGLDSAGLAHGEVRGFATPRRLAVLVSALSQSQPDQAIEKRGPPVRVAFDDSGAPTRAAEAFAEGCGVPVSALQQLDTDKGAWLIHRARIAGKASEILLPEIARAAVTQLPIPKRMRWGNHDAEFVRPVHWVVMLHGDSVVAGKLFGIKADRKTYGHRFMAPGALTIEHPAAYESLLEAQGLVIADFARRRQRLLEDCQACAQQLGGELVSDAALIDEITALVEWPVPLVAQFESRYLALPPEVLVATLQGHQRYLPLRGADGALLSGFIVVANIRSSEPEQVRAGNERVVRPRLADAEFFYNQDRNRRLEERRSQLDTIIFQRALGSLGAKAERVAEAARAVASEIGTDPDLAARAAVLAKCDLVSAMVGEFPELQGRMGRYYAQHDGEHAEVCAAIEEQYLPRFAGDALPQTGTGRALAIADRLDTLAGIFAIGAKPSGTRDPFGLRRAALGLLRILIEGELELNLHAALSAAAARQPVDVAPALTDELQDYIMERLRGYYLERDDTGGVTSEVLDAVLAMRPVSPLDCARRIHALVNFLTQDDATSLAAANKRVANLLRKAKGFTPHAVDADLLRAPAEQALATALAGMRGTLERAAEAHDYASLMATLAQLRAPIDRFFDEVMVMDDDPAVRDNRLSLLAELRAQFCRVADFGRLPG
ncbi:MAG: glycine--tRNA ligase subunit beta [Gammaproteobacteria bacterium]|nr:glycine--tRNA ligase subunit beta [Gammaproteobacteria bacterium]